MQNIKIILAYNGSNYLGWQKNQSGPSIEETLETSLEKVLSRNQIVLERNFPRKKALQAASRTDKGVHAKYQVVNFFISHHSPITLKTLSLLKHKLNLELPPDIVAYSLEKAPLAFHPSTDAKVKTYSYLVATKPFLNPFLREKVWHFPQNLSLHAMEQAAKFLLGERDFSAFCNEIASKPLYRVRKILKIEIIPATDGLYQFLIDGEAFLYKMVRNIVGTLVYVGANKIPLDQLPKRIQCKDRKLLGVTAPADGLTLEKIGYI